MSDTLCAISTQLAETVIAGGITLEFKPGSTLEVTGGELERVMEPVQAESLESLALTVNRRLSATEANPFVASFEEEDVLGNSVQLASNATANDIIPIAQGIIGKVRNNIIPATNEIFQKAYDATSDEVDRGGILVNIQTDGTEKEIWSNPALLALVAAHADTGTYDGAQIRTINFPDQPNDTLLATLHTVNPLLNPGIDALLGDEALSAVGKVYRSMFNVTGEPCDIYPRIQFLIGLLLAIALKENIPEGVTGVDDSNQYKAVLDAFGDSCAARLKQLLDYSTNITRNGRLITEFPPEGTPLTAKSTIVVNGALYNSWLESGGSVDAILGAYASRDRLTNGGDILEHKPRLEREWLKMVGIAQSAARDDFQRVFVNRLRGEIHNYAEDTGLKVKADAINTLYSPEAFVTPDTAYTFARDAVIDALFPEGEYRPLLNEIDSISESVPGISLEDATELGICDWLTSWALSQVQINKRGRE